MTTNWMSHKSIALVLIASLCAQSSAFAGAAVQATAANAKHDLVLKSVVEKIGEKYKRIADKMPKGLVATVDLLKRQETEIAIQEKIEGLKAGTVSVADMRRETLKQNYLVVKNQKAELSYQLANMRSDELDQIAQAMSGNPAYNNASAEYASAYKQTEKAKIITETVSMDLDRLMMVSTKRAGLTNKNGFLLDLQRNSAAYNSKDREEVMQALLIAGISIVGVGLVTWGISAGVYGSKLSNRREDLQSQLNSRRSQLESSYNSLSNRLNQDELSYLQNSGYVYTTCSSYQRPDSFLCSGLNYQLISGMATCTVKCMMNLSTGKQARHESPVCTSAFIPSNCNDPEEYNSGLNDGYADGYYDGYSDGSYDGEDDGANDGYNDGFDDGFSDGYDDGYSDGYNDGYLSFYPDSYTEAASSSQKSSSATGLKNAFSSFLLTSLSNNQSSKPGYSKGYQQGLTDSKSLLGLMNFAN